MLHSRPATLGSSYLGPIGYRLSGKTRRIVIRLMSFQQISNDSLHKNLYFTVDLLALPLFYSSVMYKASHRFDYLSTCIDMEH